MSVSPRCSRSSVSSSANFGPFAETFQIKVEEAILWREKIGFFPFLVWSRVARWYFFKPKVQILEGLRIGAVGTFNSHLEYFTAIWYILWPLGNIVVIWYIVSRKIWQPWCGEELVKFVLD
jgi:hypothetical protein